MPVPLLLRLYDSFARHRRRLFVAAGLAVALSALVLPQLKLSEDIAAMLPEKSPAAADFALLKQAPFSRRLIVTLEARPGTDRRSLLAASERLRAALGPPLFTGAINGPGRLFAGGLFVWLPGAMPNLLDAAELSRWGATQDRAAIQLKIATLYARMQSPEGWGIKGLARLDPLELHHLGLRKLRQLALVPGARLEGGRFISADGRYALVVAESAVPLTDSRGAEQLLSRLTQAMGESLPPGVSATVVSGHGYTHANAQAIKKDLLVTMTVSSLALVVLIVFFLRHLSGVFPFLVPFAALSLATAATALIFPAVSAIVLGFGAVLLGISVDYGLHVYFALRRGGGRAAEVLATVGRPVFFGALTTIAAFSALFFSDLPGQRQLAVFVIAGLVAALLFSLLVLPQLIEPALSGLPVPPRHPSRHRPSRAVILVLWAACCVFSLWGLGRVSFDGDPRSLSLVPDELDKAEIKLRQVWGDVRGKAMVVAEGADAAEALRVNHRLFALLAARIPAADIVSLAPLLPSPAAQEANRQAWLRFWQEGAGRRIRQDLLELAAARGFATEAFAPFLDSLTRPPAPVGPESLRGAGLGEMVDALVLPAPEGVRILTLAPDSPALAAAVYAAQKELQGLRLVSQSHFRLELGQAIRRDFVLFFSVAALFVFILVAALFRDLRRVFLALLPVATGLLVMSGTMGALGMSFTLFNILAAVLVIGLGIDYGIFMVCKMTEGYDHATDRAVLVSGLTTIAGFGALVLARHPALHSIGVTVLLGIGAAIPTALLVLPALGRRDLR